MKQILGSSMFLLAAMPLATQAQLFCSQAGNVVLFSNYDGGQLNIIVDQDIPNLMIGVVSYEAVAVVITGPYASNVTQVVYAGFNSLNDHCGTVINTTSVTGAQNATVSIQFAPQIGLPDPNGNNSMICAYSCSDQGQGGCNTAQQVAYYFLYNYGGILRSHRTQYECWQGFQSLSDGGNCCVDPLSTAVVDPGPVVVDLDLRYDGDRIWVGTAAAVDVLDASGRTVNVRTERMDGRQHLLVGQLAPGTYLVREQGTGRTTRFVVEPGAR